MSIGTSPDGRYVLINYGADQQRLYDMSNLQTDGEVGYPEQKTILYPNPAFGDHITIGNPHYGYRSYIIYDALKRIVSYGDYPEDDRIPIVDINTSGTYILALKYDTGYIEHVRFVVLK